MALNAVMLTASQPPSPVPLPGEKILIAISGEHETLSVAAINRSSMFSGIKAQLQPIQRPDTASQDTTSTAWGTVCISNKRVIFVSYKAASLASDSDAGTDLRSLSVDLGNYRDGHLVQPWFSANYYEAVVIPQQGGGLPGPHNLQLHFQEGSAYAFHTTLQTACADVAQRNEEPLRTKLLYARVRY